MGALCRAGIELARAADTLRRILDHLHPLSDPAHRARDREQDGKHVGGEAEGLERDARIEVDVGIELLLGRALVPLQEHRTECRSCAPVA